MPVTYNQLDPLEVENELRARRYGFHGNRKAAIHLTVPDNQNRFKMSGSPKRVLLRPVMPHDYNKIMREALSVKDACDQIEAIATGQQLGPQVSHPGQASAEVTERVIQNRVQNELAHATQPLADQLAKQNDVLEQQAEQISRLQAELASRVQKPKPKAKPRKSRIVQEAEREIDLSRDQDLPPLTDEQAKMLAGLQIERE